jgi:hypothetical protein
MRICSELDVDGEERRSDGERKERGEEEKCTNA